jgi:uncharacterized protein (DUF1330 family)
VNRQITVGLAMVASAALGATAVQTLHAQVKPPAYNIAEITIKDQDGYTKEYLPLITKAFTDAGGKFLVRGGKTISYEGASPAPRVVVVQFESLDKLQGRIRGYAKAQNIPVIDCPAGQRKHDLAEEYLAKTMVTQGLFLVLVGRASSLMKCSSIPLPRASGGSHPRRPAP